MPGSGATSGELGGGMPGLFCGAPLARDWQEENSAHTRGRSWRRGPGSPVLLPRTSRGRTRGRFWGPLWGAGWLRIQDFVPAISFKAPCELTACSSPDWVSSPGLGLLGSCLGSLACPPAFSIDLRAKVISVGFMITAKWLCSTVLLSPGLGPALLVHPRARSGGRSRAQDSRRGL